MKAITYDKFGGPEVLRLEEVNKPVPRDNEVLIKVYAVSINDWDWALLQSSTLLDRLIGGSLWKPGKKILGSDVAGSVESVGKNVTRFSVGDNVYGDLSGKWGGFAEYVCADEKLLALKPSKMSFEEAAAIPQAGMLAVQGLVDKGKIQKGQKVCINGAGGGVGTFGLQILKPYMAHVTCVDSAMKLDMLKSLGATSVVDYTKEDFTRTGMKYDLILDTKTNRSPFSYLRALNPNGIYATVGGSLLRLLQAFVMGPFISMFTSKKVIIVALKPNKDLGYMNELFEAGKIRPIVDGHYKLAQVQKAFEVFARAEHRGKLVITVAE